MTENILAFTFPDNFYVAQKAMGIVLGAATEAIAARGRFVLALAGGSTPQLLYSLLRDASADWQRWHLVYGDERFLNIGHPERNSTLAETAWLEHCPFPRANHHIISDNMTLADTAHSYGEMIAGLLPIDLALLGIGEDGHTASLFPQNLANDMACENLCIPVSNAPKPPAERISLGYSALNNAGTVCFLATGSSKQTILQQWQKNTALPCNRVHGLDATILLTDQYL